MPTEKPRVTFTISEEKLKIVDEYRFSNKIKNQSQAILSLLEKGLDSMENKAALSVTDEATKLAKDYDSLDPHGQRMVRLVADEELRRRELETKAQQDSQGAEAEDTMVYVTQYYRRPMSAGTGQEAGDDAPESLHLKKNRLLVPPMWHQSAAILWSPPITMGTISLFIIRKRFTQVKSASFSWTVSSGSRNWVMAF